MSSPNRPARLNRSLLALLGLVLTAAGGFVLALGFGLLGDVLPSLAPTAPVITPRTGVQPWVPYLAVAATVVVGLLCLRWLVAQALRRPKTGTWRLHRDQARGLTRIDADVAADALAADVETYPGVKQATANLAGTKHQPTLHLVVTTEQNTPISPLRARIAEHALPRLRQALELDDLPGDLLLRIDTVEPTTRTR
jgi:hypothetical protein